MSYPADWWADPPGPDEQDADDIFDRLVEHEARQVRIREAAREKVRAEKAPPMPPFDGGTISEILARPAGPPHRVDGIMPADGNTLIVAMRKTGKTTLSLNLTRSLLTGDAFLGTYEARQVSGRVGFLNYEVSGRAFAWWAHEHQIPEDRLYVANLRGARNPFNHAEDLSRLAEQLRAQDVETLIVDPFTKAFSGEQNSNSEVSAWLSRLEEFARTNVGAADLVLVAHAGWTGEHARGASELEGWPDSIITMTRTADPDDDTRYLRAEGRDVDVEEDALTFDAKTRTLRMSGTGSRKAGQAQRKLQEAKAAILIALRDEDALSGKELQVATGLRKDSTLTAAREALIVGGLIVQTKRSGQGGGYLYSLKVPQGAPTYPGGTLEPAPPPLGGQVPFANFQDEHAPDPQEDR